ncbi:hypothetical protein M8C21_031634, partial [Ambrosia artemisiifolia]
CHWRERENTEITQEIYRDSPTTVAAADIEHDYGRCGKEEDGDSDGDVDGAIGDDLGILGEVVAAGMTQRAATVHFCGAGTYSAVVALAVKEGHIHFAKKQKNSQSLCLSVDA